MKLKYLALTICLFLFSCGENIPPVDSSPETKILYLGNGTEPKDLDPHTTYISKKNYFCNNSKTQKDKLW